MPQKTSKVFIWSDVLAYVVGLLVTDGNLSNDGRHIIMRSSDRDLLETKIGITKTSGYSTRISYRVQFGDVLFYKWLLSVGLSPNKTYNIGEIEVPDLFFRDFLRGHFDGDGSLFKYIDRYNVYKDRSYTNLRVYLTLISASHEHILWLHKKIQELTNVKGALLCNISKHEKKVPIWVIKFSKKESIVLLKWIYYRDDLPCLNRKRILARNILRLTSREKRKAYTKIANGIPRI